MFIRVYLWPFSRQHVLDHIAMHVGQAEIATLEAIGQLLVIDAQAVQDRGVQVVNVDRLVGDVVAEIVGLAVDDAAA